MAGKSATLEAHLRSFVDAHPQGWDHRAWEALLARLAASGFAPGDPDAVGLTVERIRLEGFLEGLGVTGLGPKRRQALVETFGRLWDLRRASTDDLAGVPGMNRPVAEALRRALD